MRTVGYEGCYTNPGMVSGNSYHGKLIQMEAEHRLSNQPVGAWLTWTNVEMKDTFHFSFVGREQIEHHYIIQDPDTGMYHNFLEHYRGSTPEMVIDIILRDVKLLSRAFSVNC